MNSVVNSLIVMNESRRPAYPLRKCPPKGPPETWGRIRSWRPGVANLPRELRGLRIKPYRGAEGAWTVTVAIPLHIPTDALSRAVRARGDFGATDFR